MIEISGTFDRDIVLATGSMLAPMRAMRQCLDELLTHWGIDAEAHRSLRRPAMPRNQRRLALRVISSYPSSALRRELSERVHVRLEIGADGSVEGCHLQMPVSDEVFREHTCNQLSRANFEPALDASGNPIRSYWATIVIYVARRV